MADFVAQELPAAVFSVVADSADVSVVASGGGSVAAIYAQRVWSTGSAEWCYYTTALNATPASGITAPNWVGSATDYEVISRRLN